MPSLDVILLPLVLAALVGLVLGFGVGTLLRRDRLRSQELELGRLREERAGLQARLEAERDATAEKVALVEAARDRLARTFQALSAEALESSSASFLRLAKREMEALRETARGDMEARQKAISELVRPLSETLGQVDRKLEEVEKTRREAYGGLTEHLKSVAQSQDRLRGETARLTRALRAPNVRGRWGEIQLERLVELAGLAEHSDFLRQPTLDGGGDSPARRPDLVVYLPSDRSLVIDAKAPLDHYLQALEQDDETARRKLLGDHARQVRQRLQELAAKAYWERLSGSPEFVVLFLPGETFLTAALEQDPSLMEFGLERRVILATPMTLVALLHAVAYGWRQERAAENAREVTELGRELYERLRTFAGHFEDLRRHLDQSVASYNQAVGSFERRVLVSARRFRDLGAASGDELPEVESVERRGRELSGTATEDL